MSVGKMDKMVNLYTRYRMDQNKTEKMLLTIAMNLRIGIKTFFWPMTQGFPSMIKNNAIA